jgi:hypothetical protein
MQERRYDAATAGYRTQTLKDIRVDIFFYKGVMLRDRLRVPEQNTNAQNIE